jgi:hypothetical protein
MAYPESLRDRLPRTEAYPVRRTHLDAAMAAAEVEAVSLVYFLRAGIDEWRASGSGKVLAVEFTAAGPDRPESMEIRVHAVPKDRNQLVAKALAPELLSRVAQWIRAAETSENVWRSQDHGLVVRWDGEALGVNET